MTPSKILFSILESTCSTIPLKSRPGIPESFNNRNYYRDKIQQEQMARYQMMMNQHAMSLGGFHNIAGFPSLNAGFDMHGLNNPYLMPGAPGGGGALAQNLGMGSNLGANGLSLGGLSANLGGNQGGLGANLGGSNLGGNLGGANLTGGGLGGNLGGNLSGSLGNGLSNNLVNGNIGNLNQTGLDPNFYPGSMLNNTNLLNQGVPVTTANADYPQTNLPLTNFQFQTPTTIAKFEPQVQPVDPNQQIQVSQEDWQNQQNQGPPPNGGPHGNPPQPF